MSAPLLPLVMDRLEEEMCGLLIVGTDPVRSEIFDLVADRYEEVAPMHDALSLPSPRCAHGRTSCPVCEATVESIRALTRRFSPRKAEAAAPVLQPVAFVMGTEPPAKAPRKTVRGKEIVVAPRRGKVSTLSSCSKCGAVGEYAGTPPMCQTCAGDGREGRG